MIPNLSIDIATASDELARLAKCSDTRPPVTNRIAFTPRELKARAVVVSLMRDAGLEVREDAAGNLFGRWGDRGQGAIGTGSHLDSLPNGGRQDGTVGVIGGLEAIRALRRAGFRPGRAIELIVFSARHRTRFPAECIGSGLLAGTLTPAAARKLKDADGKTFEEIRQSAGCSGELDSVAMGQGDLAAFIELHIETAGGQLDRQGAAIGIADDMDSNLATAVEAAALELSLKYARIAPGERHDAVTLAGRVPSNMIFVPTSLSAGNETHASPRQIEMGIRTLATTLASLSNGRWVKLEN